MKKISVVISTYNREMKLIRMLQNLSDQTISLDEYEIIVIDNGSDTPFNPSSDQVPANCRIIRFNQNLERVIARNKGVEISNGELILISDDDMVLGKDFLENHIKTHKEHENLLVVGRVLLPDDKLDDNWRKFRQNFELQGMPIKSSFVESDNFCTAQNMSIRKASYDRIKGFDNSMTGIEDQDFAIRHRQNGGRIFYLFEAIAIHDDDYLEFNQFCLRQENASRWSVKFGIRYPEREDVKERIRINSYVKLGREPLKLTLKKLVKQFCSPYVISKPLTNIVSVTGKILNNEKILRFLYSLIIGIYIQRGFRKGLKEVKQ